MTSPRLVGLARRGWWWFCDYVYVTYHQLRAFVRRTSPDELLAGDPDRSPVVLIPGVYEPWGFMAPLARALSAAGHPVHVLPGLGYNRGPVADAAVLVGAYLAERDLRDVVVVAHSKGGLIGKLTMLREDPEGRVRGMVTINTPFAGSVYARLVPVRAVRAFVPTDATLVALAAERSVDARITSLASCFDPHVPAGSVLEGAVNIRLGTPGHFRVLADPRLLPVVLEAVRRPPGTAPEETR